MILLVKRCNYATLNFFYFEFIKRKSLFQKNFYFKFICTQYWLIRVLAGVKYSIEFHRTTKSVNDYNTLKCSELESFEFYTGLLVVENILPKIYLDHYLTYLTALRLLTNDKIDHDDITSAFALLNYFVMRFEKLYGLEHMTYKIHSLTHLEVKVLNSGPLHKHAAFHFEGSINFFIL